MTSTLDQILAALPVSLQPGVKLAFERLPQNGRDIPDDSLAPLATLFACSEFAASVVAREFAWFIDQLEDFSNPGDRDTMHRFANAVAASTAGVDVVKSELRRFRNRTLVRILWREVHALADLDETLQQLSLLADATLDAAMRFATKEMAPRYGRVRDKAGDIVPMVVLGMGKLGGKELNFSSDIDVIFCYAGPGQSDGPKSVTAEEYFARLSRQVVALLDERTADGFVFRIDTRLRPFGDSGPPVVSFSALESYLLQHGRAWERYAYVKARIVGTRPPAAVANELYDELIRPFVYRRYLDYGVFEAVREMQELIASDERRRDLKDNVKLGPGGIREAEFIVQALQLVRGGSDVRLQDRGLQTVLPRLVNSRGISAAAADEIRAAYRYLRRLENFIQAMHDRQTHDLPAGELDRQRLCLAMGYGCWSDLLDELEQHRTAISSQFAAVAFREHDDESPDKKTLKTLWTAGADEQQWVAALDALAGEHAASLASELVRFSSLRITQQIDSVASGRLAVLVPALLERVMMTDDPVLALARSLTIIEQILRRSAYLALLNENPDALSKLVQLCAESLYIAERLTRYPVLLDELLVPASQPRSFDKAALGNDLVQHLSAIAADDSEARIQALAEFQRAAMFRIAVADFSGDLPIMKVSDSLTWLAEVVLTEALRVAWSDTTARHGVPRHTEGGVVKEAGFGIIAYGKLGGLELSYGSDLDIVFLHDATGEQGMTDGQRPLDNTMFFSRLVRRLMHFLTIQTGSGELYEIDTRLRPDGRSGLLVTNTAAFERYQEENAWTWEHQALLRARPAAGSDAIAVEFERIRVDTLTGRVNRDTLQGDVTDMRRRMRKELDRSDKKHFDLKHGVGGIGDIEFLVQYLVLQKASSNPDLIRFTDNIRQLDALVAANILDSNTGHRLQGTYKAYRLLAHRKGLNGQKARVAAAELVAEREFVAGVWDSWLA